MNQMRRTTIRAGTEALATLAAEAERRGVPTSDVIAEAIDEKATEIRTRRRPRVGIGRSTDGRSAQEVTAEPIAHPPH